MVTDHMPRAPNHWPAGRSRWLLAPGLAVATVFRVTGRELAWSSTRDSVTHTSLSSALGVIVATVEFSPGENTRWVTTGFPIVQEGYSGVGSIAQDKPSTQLLLWIGDEKILLVVSDIGCGTQLQVGILQTGCLERSCGS
jgi:hypothetical protein